MIFDRFCGKLRSLAVLTFLTLTALCLSSCGYHMGSMMHPQIKTIGFADVRNETKEPMLIPILRGQLAEQFQTDGSLKVVEKDSADCILYCRVVKVGTEIVREETMTGVERPREFRLTIVADFTVLVPGRSEPLIPLRRIDGSSLYQYEGDPQVARLACLKLASRELARMAVQYTTEAW